MTFLVIKELNTDTLKMIKRRLDEGKMVVFPTETIYGIGVSLKKEQYFINLMKAKKRNEKKPFALMTHSLQIAEKYFNFGEKEKKIAMKFLPGPVTLLLERKDTIPSWYFGDFRKIGLRIPDNEIAKKILSFYGDILAVTSANISECEEARNFEKAYDYFGDNEDVLLVDGGECKLKIASTVVEIEEGKLKILREGPIKKRELEEVLND